MFMKSLGVGPAVFFLGFLRVDVGIYVACIDRKGGCMNVYKHVHTCAYTCT